MSKNYYSVLGVQKSASKEELKAAYRKLAVQHHPDKNAGNKDAERKFKEISEAYDILKDDQKRAAYDQYGSDAFSQGAGNRSGPKPSGGGFGGFDFNQSGDFFRYF